MYGPAHELLHPFNFEYSLKITVGKGSFAAGIALQPVDEKLYVTGGRFSRTLLLDCTERQAQMLNDAQFHDLGSENYARTLSPPDATMLSRLYDLQTNRRSNLFKRYLQSWLYYNLNPDAMRSPRVVSDRLGIHSDGSNLSKALFVLHSERPRIAGKIIETLRMIEPKAELFSFSSPDPQSAYLFMEDKNENRFGPQSLSDGTLRYLVFSYLIHTLDEEKAKAQFSPFIIIEEPENGIYVGHLRALFEKIDTSGAHGQFMFTTHSPYVIDLWENNLPGVHLLRPGTPFSALLKVNPEKMNTMLDGLSLGELHYREMLA